MITTNDHDLDNDNNNDTDNNVTDSSIGDWSQVDTFTPQISDQIEQIDS